MLETAANEVRAENEIAQRLMMLDNVEERILSTALKYFETQGYYKTNVEDIAKEIGIGKGTIYRHFGDKFHLLCYTLGFAMLNTYEELKQTLHIEDPYLALNTYITEGMRMSKSFVNIRKTSTMEITFIYMKELSENTDFIKSVIYMSRICATDILAPIIKKCMVKNNLEIDNLFISQCISMFIDAFSNTLSAAEFLERHYGCDQDVIQLTNNPEEREVQLKRFLLRSIGTPEDVIVKYTSLDK